MGGEINYNYIKNMNETEFTNQNNQNKKKWLTIIIVALIIFLIGGFGLQVGLFTYYKGLSAITCSTSVASGSISGVSMILCCSHYILNFLPFLGALVGISALTTLTKYTPYFLWFGVLSNAVGIGVIYYQKNKFSRSKNER